MHVARTTRPSPLTTAVAALLLCCAPDTAGTDAGSESGASTATGATSSTTASPTSSGSYGETSSEATIPLF
jgi:hypothetical protein